VRVRHAEADRDAAACSEIYAPFVLDTAISFEEQPPEADEMRRRIEETTTCYPWLVAEDDGRVAGFAYASQHRQRAAYRWAVDVAIYVEAAQQRHGIGRALYEALFELLAAQGFRIACAGIALPNPASIALHERLGFQPVGVYRRIGFKAGAWYDVGWWQLALGTGDDLTPGEPKPPPL
jgi:L-amino acid N-acyltransferase YncA